MVNRAPSSHKPKSPTELWTQVFLILLLSIMIILIVAPLFIGGRRSAHKTTAINNSKQIYYTLVDFDYEFGTFPNDETALADERLTEFTGDHSNDYLGQIIAAEFTNTEEIFFAKGAENLQKPDNVISSKDEILSEGECGFAYVKGYSTSSPSGIPVLLAPMYGDGHKFDPYIFSGQAAAIRIDGSLKQYRLNKDRLAISHGETPLFKTTTDSVWGEEGFDSDRLLLPKGKYHPKYPTYKIKENMGTLVLIAFVLVIGLYLFHLFKQQGKVNHLASDSE